MGAAKNARKARRKADRRDNRRAYVFDLETVRKLPAGGIGDLFISSALLTEWDPVRMRNVEIGQSVELSQEELDRVLKAGFFPKRKGTEDEVAVTNSPKGIFDFPNWFDNARLKSYLDDKRRNIDFKDYLQDFGAVAIDPGVEYRTHRTVGGKSFTTAVASNRERPSPWDAVDYSALEYRIASEYGLDIRDVAKKVAYMKAYNAMEKDIDRMFFDDMMKLAPMPSRPPAERNPPHRFPPYYMGLKADMMIIDDPIMQGDQDDQDVPEVGKVPADRT